MEPSLPVLLNQPRARPRRLTAGPPGAYVLLFAVCGLVLLVGLSKIYLQRRTTRLGLIWEQEHRKLRTMLKERQNCLIERERYMNGGYILDQARRLGLQSPQPGQVRKMTPRKIGNLNSTIPPKHPQ